MRETEIEDEMINSIFVMFGTGEAMIEKIEKHYRDLINR